MNLPLQGDNNVQKAQARFHLPGRHLPPAEVQEEEPQRPHRPGDLLHRDHRWRLDGILVDREEREEAPGDPGRSRRPVGPRLKPTTMGFRSFAGYSGPLMTYYKEASCCPLLLLCPTTSPFTRTPMSSRVCTNSVSPLEKSAIWDAKCTPIRRPRRCVSWRTTRTTTATSSTHPKARTWALGLNSQDIQGL